MLTSVRRYYRAWSALLIVAASVVLYLALLWPWMNHWGLSVAEARMPLPGDGVESGTVATSTRAVRVAAPASAVWSWVVQLGQERAGFYSNDWLENLTLADIHNRDVLVPAWQHRGAGDLVLGTGGIYGADTGWRIKHYVEGQELYLWGPIVVLPDGPNASRLVVRTYAAPKAPLAEIVDRLTYGWIHFVMERGMLLGIQARAEHRSTVPAIPLAGARLGWGLAVLGVVVLFLRRGRGGWWGLISVLYAGAIVIFTGDVWSAAAGFVWWGVVVAGFMYFGSSWWKSLALIACAVVLTFVLADQPFVAFGLIFLGGSIVWLVAEAPARRELLRPGSISAR